MWKNKKGVGLYEQWVEVLTLIILIVGFVMAMLSTSAVITYALVFVCGLIIGVNFYIRRFRVRLPYTIIMLGFLVGFLLGSFYGNYKVIIISFIIGNVIGYYVYSTGILERYYYMR